MCRAHYGWPLLFYRQPAFSFLGLGAQPPSSEWGTMLSSGRDFLFSAPYIAIFPGLAIAFLVLGFNIFGDGLRDAFDPRMKKIKNHY
nr:ABC transporter permease subunit [Planococcus glaciei]